jgi:hypothetical protein
MLTVFEVANLKVDEDAPAFDYEAKRIVLNDPTRF